VLPDLEGTVAVATRLGFIDLHPYIQIADPQRTGRTVKVAYPYQGDLLLFLRTELGEAFCINWTVKSKQRDFLSARLGARNPTSADEKLLSLARFQIEAAYYSDAAIRTHPVADEDIHPELANNLCTVFPYTWYVANVNDKRRREIVDAFQLGLVTETPPTDVITMLVARRRCGDHDARVILHQAIWERELKVDLFEPVLVDYPLVPAQQDPLERYAHWFAP